MKTNFQTSRFIKNFNLLIFLDEDFITEQLKNSNSIKVYLFKQYYNFNKEQISFGDLSLYNSTILDFGNRIEIENLSGCERYKVLRDTDNYIIYQRQEA